MRYFAILLFAVCAQGRAEPVDRVIELEGLVIFEHIDHDDNPCRVRGLYTGCYALVDDQHHVWYHSQAPAYISRHEYAHAKGMAHTDWESTGRGACATILRGAEGYPRGATICNNGRREAIF